MNGQGDVDLIDGVGDVSGDAFLTFYLGSPKHVLEQSLGFAHLGIRQRLRLPVFDVAAKIHAEQFAGDFNLVHSPHAMAFVIVIAGGQNEVGVPEHPGFRSVTERHGLILILNDDGAAQRLGC